MLYILARQGIEIQQVQAPLGFRLHQSHKPENIQQGKHLLPI